MVTKNPKLSVFLIHHNRVQYHDEEAAKDCCREGGNEEADFAQKELLSTNHLNPRPLLDQILVGGPLYRDPFIFRFHHYTI